jgi:class 3 adenylate cyclase
MSSNQPDDKFASSKVSSDHEERENEHADMLQFFGKAHFCTVSVIDIVNSTKATANISPAKLGDFYSIFLNGVIDIVKKNGGTVVKNMGYSLLYYFAVCDTSGNCIADAFKCNFQIIEKRDEINKSLVEKGFPNISDRIGSDYGKVFVAMSAISSIDDIFGPTVNMCGKINHVGESNRFFIGNDLYIHAKSVNEFKFDEIHDQKCSILKFDYHVYYIKKHNINSNYHQFIS